MNRLRLLSSIALVFILLALAGVGQAQDASAVPEVTIVASADGVVIPENISRRADDHHLHERNRSILFTAVRPAE